MRIYRAPTTVAKKSTSTKPVEVKKGVVKVDTTTPPPPSLKATKPPLPPADLFGPAVQGFLDFKPTTLGEGKAALEQASGFLHFALYNEATFASLASRSDASEVLNMVLGQGQKLADAESTASCIKPYETFLDQIDQLKQALLAFQSSATQRPMNTEEEKLFGQVKCDDPSSWTKFLTEVQHRYGNDNAMQEVIAAGIACVEAYNKNPLDLQAALAYLINRAQNYNGWFGKNKVVAKQIAKLAQQIKSQTTQQISKWANKSPTLKGNFDPKELFLPVQRLQTQTTTPTHHHVESRPLKGARDHVEVRFLNEFDEFTLDKSKAPLVQTVSSSSVELDSVHNHTIESSKPLFAGDPSPKDIQQGRLGDCYLLAVLAAMARKDSRQIRNMIQEYSSFVMVRFFDTSGVKPKEVWVQVPKSLVVDDKDNVTQAKGNAAWPAFVEKAFVMFNDESLSNIGGLRGVHKSQILALTGKSETVYLMSTTGFPHVFSCYDYIAPLSDDLAQHKILQRRFLRSLCDGLSNDGVEKVLTFNSDKLSQKDHVTFMTHLRTKEFSRLTCDPILGKLPVNARVDIATQLEVSPTFRKALQVFLEKEGKDVAALQAIAKQGGVSVKQLQGVVDAYYAKGAQVYFDIIKKRLASGGFGYLGTRKEMSRQETGLVGGHAYEIVSVREHHNQAYVRLRNPWGHAGVKYQDGRMVPDPKADEFELSMGDVMKTMRAVTMGTCGD